MLPDVFAVLNVAAVRAFVGTNPPRIYRHGNAPLNVAAPYLTWHVVSGTPENLIDGTPPIDNVSVQVDCWTNNTGTGSQQAHDLAEAVRDAIEVSHHVTQFGSDTQDFETQRFRVSLTFSFWNHRS